eukprot:CAMPEP_0169448462 /NCGR_PEP_ID=MMETSP1042-20121227/12054_1 /TAXON_ID=464988 /ORGANISM="Hemiselmis andersenii, Strain CCMP1180" /LENGTH=34 /DNA_ID= /DNA_START= /DNA_END= /DNA_ORIENTATION=
MNLDIHQAGSGSAYPIIWDSPIRQPGCQRRAAHA